MIRSAACALALGAATAPLGAEPPVSSPETRAVAHAWNRHEGYAFADAVLRSGQPWLRPEETVAKGPVCKVRLVSDRPLDDHAVLVHTADRGFTGDRTWTESPAGLSGGDGRYQVTASIPVEATAWFFNVTADGLHASAGFESRP